MQIFPAPVRLSFNHAPERAGSEGVRGVVKGNGDPASVRVTVVTMTSSLTLQDEAVRRKSRDQPSSGERP